MTVLDFDHLTAQKAKELKYYIFENYSVIVASWLSPSKHGVKALLRIPMGAKNVSEFHQYYDAIKKEFQQFQGFDPTNKNPVQPLFQSYDPDILFRPSPDIWTAKAPPAQPPLWPPTFTRDDKHHDRKREAIFKGLETACRNIGETHHPRIRDIAVTYGGYCPQYIDKAELMQFLETVIQCDPYMRNNATGYIKTVSQGIDYGMSKPMEFNFSTHGS